MLKLCMIAFASSTATFTLAEVDNVPTKVAPAHVRFTGDSKRGPYVVIDRGTQGGYGIGADICFYDERDQQTACGVIERSNPHAAGIRLDQERAAKVKIGQRAWPQDLGPIPSLEERDSQGAASDEEVEGLVQNEPTVPAVPDAPPLLQRRWYFDYKAALVLPVVVNALKFDGEARASGVGSVWDSGDSQRQSLVGFALGLQQPHAGPRNQTWEFGYQFLPQSPIESSFDVTDASQTVVSGVSGHFYRLRWLYGASLKHTETSDWLIGSGLEFTWVNHKFSAEKSDGTPLAEGAIRHYLFNIPVSTWYEWHRAGWNFNTGLDLTFPMLLTKKTTTGSVDYSEETQASKDIDALFEAVNPRINFGVSLRLGMGAKF